jgi:hypothetical protein
MPPVAKTGDAFVRGRRRRATRSVTIVSGGQTGVDRAALDAALALGLSCGGWCPKGRRAEDGPIDPRYPLRETRSADYATRTRLNVRDSDATLALVREPVSGGTALAVRLAWRFQRPLLVVDLNRARPSAAATVRRWIVENGIHVLNVAGPRESRAPGIHTEAMRFLKRVLRPRRNENSISRSI